MSAAYHEFDLDGFHNRLVRDWGRDPVYGAKVTMSRGAIIPGYYTKRMRWIPPHTVRPCRVVTTVSYRTACCKHARIHGAAGAWHADDSFTFFYRDGDKIRTRTYRHARPVATENFRFV